MGTSGNWFTRIIQKLLTINEDVLVPTLTETGKDITIATPFTALTIANLNILDDILGSAAAGLNALNGQAGPVQAPATSDIVKVASPAAVAVLTSSSSIPAGHVIADAAGYKAGAQLIVEGRAQMLAALAPTSGSVTVV